MGTERGAHHFGEAARSDDEAGVDEAVQMPRRRLEVFPLVVIEILVGCADAETRSVSGSADRARQEGGGGQARRTGRVGDEVERGRVALHLCVEAREVEAIEDVLLVDLAEVLVALRREEPAAAGTRRKG